MIKVLPRGETIADISDPQRGARRAASISEGNNKERIKKDSNDNAAREMDMVKQLNDLFALACREMLSIYLK